MPTKSSLFIDTSGWLSIVNPRDAFHAAASGVLVAATRQQRTLVTTNYVIAELVALLSMSRYGIGRRDIIAQINAIKADPTVEILHIDVPTDDEAWKLLEARQDKAWSLVDASSFVLMWRHGMTEALTTDQHFTQAGFTQLSGS